MDVSMGNFTYMNTVVSKAIQVQGQVLLKLLSVNEEVQKVQAKPMGNLGHIPEHTFEAVA